MKIKITNNLKNEAIPQTKEVSKKLILVLRETMSGYADVVHKDIQAFLDGGMVKRKTGKLYRSQDYSVQWHPNQNLIKAIFYNTDPVAPILHRGVTQPYPIHPRGRGNNWIDLRGKKRTGKNLMIFEYQGKIWRAKNIMRGAMAPRPFIQQPLFQRIPQIESFLQTALGKQF